MSLRLLRQLEGEKECGVAPWDFTKEDTVHSWRVEGLGSKVNPLGEGAVGRTELASLAKPAINQIANVLR